MTEPRDDSQVVSDEPRPVVVTERFIEELEKLASEVSYRAQQHGDYGLLETHHKLHLLTRVLRRDDEITHEDFQGLIQ